MATKDADETLEIIEKESDDFFLDLIKERSCLYKRFI